MEQNKTPLDFIKWNFKKNNKKRDNENVQDSLKFNNIVILVYKKEFCETNKITNNCCISSNDILIECKPEEILPAILHIHEVINVKLTTVDAKKLKKFIQKNS